MSYSFQAKGSSKREVINNVRSQLADVARGQPCHHAEFDEVMSHVKRLVALTHVPEGSDIVVDLCGSVWENTENNLLNSVQCNASVYTVKRG